MTEIVKLLLATASKNSLNLTLNKILSERRILGLLLQQLDQLQLDLQNQISDARFQPQEELVSVAPDQLVHLLLHDGQVRFLVRSVWVVPGVGQDEVVNFPDVFPDIKPALSKTLKFVALFGFNVAPLPAGGAVARRGGQRRVGADAFEV